MKHNGSLAATAIAVLGLAACSNATPSKSAKTNTPVGIGAAARLDGATTVAPAGKKTPNPDTAVLSGMLSVTGAKITKPIHLRSGTITIAPDGAVRPVLVANAMRTTTKLGVAVSPQGCKEGLLTDTDMYQVKPDGSRTYLYTKRAVWVCFQTNVPAEAVNSTATVMTNVVTFVDATTGTVLFTTQDDAVNQQ